VVTNDAPGLSRETAKEEQVPSREIKNYVPKDKGWSVTTGRLLPKPSKQPSEPTPKQQPEQSDDTAESDE
jgi:hypothetical protein